MTVPPQTQPISFTAAGVREGMRAILPMIPSLLAFAVAFGTAAASRGLTLWQTVAMSAFVSGGASQMLSLELWRESWTLATVVTVALVTATVNARFVLQGASLQPWLRGTPAWAQAGSLFFLFEASWLAAERHRAAGGRDLGAFVGAGVLSWAIWVAATAPGYLAGALISDPKRYGIDLILPLFFAAMAVPLWRGVRVSAAPWIVAAAVAASCQALVPGYLFIVAGAVAGALTGALARDRR